MVLALNVRDLSFTSAFIQHSSASIDILKQLAKESGAGERLQHTVALCHRLRMLYRDCAKPPPPPTRQPSRAVSGALRKLSRRVVVPHVSHLGG